MGMDSIPGWGTRILHATWHGPPKQTTTEKTHIKIYILDKHQHLQVTGRRISFHLSRSAVGFCFLLIVFFLPDICFANLSALN